MTVQRLPFDEFIKIYTQVPRACIDLIIDTPEGVILTKRSIPPEVGSWHMPGGGILFKETLEEAALRIAESELGVVVQLGRLVGYAEHLDEQREYGVTHSISLVFMASIVSGELRGSDQGKEFKAFKNLPENTMSTHRAVLEQYLKSVAE